MSETEGYKYQIWVFKPETDLSLGDEAPLLAAREIVKQLELSEVMVLPVMGYDAERDESRLFEYDEVVSIIEESIRYFFGLEPKDETADDAVAAT